MMNSTRLPFNKYIFQSRNKIFENDEIILPVGIYGSESVENLICSIYKIQPFIRELMCLILLKLELFLKLKLKLLISFYDTTNRMEFCNYLEAKLFLRTLATTPVCGPSVPFHNIFRILAPELQ